MLSNIKRSINNIRINNFLINVSNIHDIYYFLKSQYYYKYFFGGIGNKSKLIMPMRINNPRYIYIKNHVIINKYSFITTILSCHSNKPEIIIDNGTIIGHFNHISAVNSVYIGKNVLTADKVYISDHNHEYRDILKPVMHQGVYSTGIVRIGDGSWIGENVCIISAIIGRNCVIAANSVVTKDIPDYCVAGGIPARILKRYDPPTNTWLR